MFTCSLGEELLFPNDNPSPQQRQRYQQQQEHHNLQERCKLLEKESLQFKEFLRNLRIDYEKKIETVSREREAELHRLGTCHAINRSDLEQKYLQKLQDRSDDILKLQMDLRDRSNHILTLTNEIEALQHRHQDLEEAYEQDAESMVWSSWH
jgi:chromosome segregation ATPase